MLRVGAKVIARMAAIPSSPPRSRSTANSRRYSSTTSTGVASTTASWAADGGTIPVSSPATAGKPSASYIPARAWASRTGALGRIVAALEWAS